MDSYEDPASKRARLDDGPSEADILRLVAQRESYRQSRQFDKSDAIREELRNMGVELYDKEKEWRCRDGRRGTLFTAGPMECMLADHEIQDRINQREDARRSKDWGRADMLRDDLRAHGVELDDKHSSWATSSGRSGTYSGQPSAAPRAAAQLSSHHIRKLVAERERLRATQDFELADELRRQLATMGVEIFDNDRTWRSADGQRGVIITGGHEVDCLLTDADIHYRVMQREEARSAKDFNHADAIRDDLRRQGVELLDGQRLWVTTDGRQGHYTGGSAAAQTPNLAAYGQPAQTNQQLAAGLAAAFLGSQATQQQQALGGRLPSSPITNNPSAMTLQTASIVALVVGREKARDTHDWASADAIRADLRTHGVDVWDKEKVWRANDGRSGTINR